MTVLWILFLFFVLAFYQNLEVEYHYEILRKEHDGLDIAGHSIELSTSRENLLAASYERPSTAARRWYFIEENFDKETVSEPVTFATYADGTLISLSISFDDDQFDSISEFLHDDTVVLFGMTTILFFGQVSIEVTYYNLFFSFFIYFNKFFSFDRP